ncbi:hypothetical protein GCM10027578_15570 [Spirosoma luteolum]
MESIYDWLLHNIGNEGNYLTILNTHRSGDTLTQLDVMARTKAFQPVDLLITPADAPAPATEKTELAHYTFAGPDDLIEWLATGSTPQTEATPALTVSVLQPADGADSITFP